MRFCGSGGFLILHSISGKDRRKLMKIAGLLISSERLREREAASEIWGILYDHANLSLEVQELRIGGLIILSGEAIAWSEIAGTIYAHSEELLFSQSVLPIERFVPTSLQSISLNLSDLLEMHGDFFKPDRTWKISLRKRHTQLHTKEIIESAAEQVTARYPASKVDLSNPDTICSIEVLGDITGLSILHRGMPLRLRKDGTIDQV
jgi:tRNA(Ser,Leu) C12 N-acetylase TAN1